MLQSQTTKHQRKRIQPLMQNNMDRKSVIFLLAAIFALARVGVAADTCYECLYDTVSGGDERCEDPFDMNSGVPTVNNCQTGCIKTSLDNSVSVVWARTCNTGSISECPNRCESAGGITACAHCCTGDRCNGVGTVSVSFLALTCGSLLAVLVGRSCY